MDNRHVAIFRDMAFVNKNVSHDALYVVKNNQKSFHVAFFVSRMKSYGFITGKIYVNGKNIYDDYSQIKFSLRENYFECVTIGTELPSCFVVARISVSQ